MTEPTARDLKLDEARDAWLRAADAGDTLAMAKIASLHEERAQLFVIAPIELSRPGPGRERRSPTHGAQEAG